MKIKQTLHILFAVMVAAAVGGFVQKANAQTDNALAFDAGGEYVNIPGFVWPAGGGPITVEFWNYVSTSEVRQGSGFGAGGFQDNNHNRLQAHTPWSNKFLFWDYSRTKTSTGRISTDYSAHLDKWTHVALVSEGHGGNFQAIYLDGILVASANTSDGPAPALTGLDVGRWVNKASRIFYHKGKMDEFRIWNVVRSQTDIEGNMCKNLDGDENGLVGYWRMNETSGATVFDATANASNGTMINMETTDRVLADDKYPTADAGADAEIFEGASVQIGGVTTGSGGTGVLSYSWLPTDGLDDPSSANPTAEPATTTTYTVTVTDENGCEATDEVTVTVLSNADVVSEACAAVQALIDDPATDPDALGALQEAKGALDDALASTDPEDLFDTLREAAERLEEAREDTDGADEIASELADLARHIALEKREDAFECDPSPTDKMADDIDHGDSDLADGDAEAGDTYFGDAIKDYKKAWEDYCGALDRCENPKTVNSEPSTNHSSQLTVHSFALHQNYPNPFNPSTTIQFDLIEAGQVSLKIYNSAGQLVKTLVSDAYNPGSHNIVWDARDDSGTRVASGLYLYTIKVGQHLTAQRKLLLMK